jgi:hypothetical protein
MTLSSRAIGVASVIVLVVSAAPALAQRQDGPYGGVLGGNTTANARHGLSVEGSLFGAWDDILTDVPPATAVPGSSGEAPADGSVPAQRRRRWGHRRIDARLEYAKDRMAVIRIHIDAPVRRRQQ